MRTRLPKAPGHALAADERTELQRLLAAIAIGAGCHDPRITAFVDAWRLYHVPNAHTPIHNIRCTTHALAELLESLRITLDDPTLTIKTHANCIATDARTSGVPGDFATT